MTDNADEFLGSGDLEGSPVDSDEHIDVMGYARPSTGFVDHPKYNLSQSRSEPPFQSLDRSNGPFDSRVSFGPSSTMQPRHMLQQQQSDVNYPFPQSQSQHQLQSSTAYNDVTPQGWPPRVERLQPTWLGTNGNSNHRQTPYSPSTPSSTWSNSSNGPTTPSSTSPNYFPTLNTPFYPGQPSIADYQSISSPTSHSHPMSTPSPLYEPVSHAQPNMMSKEYAPRVYSSNGGIQLDNSSYPTPSSRTALSYPQRNLPRVQTSMEYRTSQPLSSSSSGHGSVPAGFWSRE